ncbi:glutamate receptor 1-like [Scylla paramamosain]|uniref:glutamate receptor 1-like n=1 Tax=Scylla paramamosain TaxID=85552 RepID=UPI0030827572
MTPKETERWSRALQRSALWTWSALLAQKSHCSSEVVIVRIEPRNIMASGKDEVHWNLTGKRYLSHYIRVHKPKTDVPWEPSHGTARAMAGLWLLAAFTLASVYRSNLKAMLIIPKVNLPFDSLEELADSGISAGVFEGTTIHHQILEADNSSSLGRIKRQLRLYYVSQAPVAIRDIYDGKMAAVSFSQGLLSTMHADFSQTGECRTYRMSRGFLGPAILSLAFPKGSPLKAKFDPVILSLRESGIMNKLFSDVLFNATECAKPVSSSLASSNQRPLEMMDFFGVFSLYAVVKIVDRSAASRRDSTLSP